MVGGLGAKCSVLNCSNYKMQADRKSFYRFPKDLNLCGRWVQLCRPDLKWAFDNYGSGPLYRHTVCSDHFQTKDFRNPRQLSQGVFRGSLPSLHLPRTRLEQDTNAIAEVSDTEQVEVLDDVVEVSDNEQFEVLEIISTSPERRNSDFESNQASPSTSGIEPTFVDPLRESPSELSNRNNNPPALSESSPGPSLSNATQMSDILCKLLPEHSTSNLQKNFKWDTVSLLKALRAEAKESIRLKQLHTKYRRQQKLMSKYRQKLFQLRATVKQLKSQPCKNCKTGNGTEKKNIHHSIVSMPEDHEGYDARSARYLENEKKFAVALYFCSAKTYAILQKHFCLPSVKSLKRWVQEMELRPEMSKPLIDLFDDRSEPGVATTPTRTNQQVDGNGPVDKINEQVNGNKQVNHSIDNVYKNELDQISQMDQIGLVDQMGLVDQIGLVDQTALVDQTGLVSQIGQMEQIGQVEQIGHVNRFGQFDNIMVDIVQQQQSTVLVDSINNFYVLQPLLQYIK